MSEMNKYLRQRLQAVSRFLMTGMMMLTLVSFLGGCLYPGGSERSSPETIGEDLQRVQKSVDGYVRDTLSPPVREAAWDAEKKITGVPIDFSLLIGRYLVDIPKSAFERGGRYRYVLLSNDDGFVVRLLDLTLAQRVSDVQQKVNDYRQRTGRLPFATPLPHQESHKQKDGAQDIVYSLDTEALAGKIPALPSPYSSYYLPLIITAEGRVYLDYALDLALLKERATEEDDPILKGTIDARWLFIQHTPFVPAVSLPYRFDAGEPILVRSVGP
ncbi:MAG: hypothetical protein RBR24_07805 [Candidatus Carbobacillus sp.]|nr:hypothetical protein [Candidatus Carbobacillus sp.]